MSDTRTPLSFQAMILRLHAYWAERGCVILQPYDMEMGAGTFHPATTLRALGPDAWNAAFVQPCRRPTDGRYGENPNRLQHYYQYQVILKPSPPDLQELYLGSLAAIGIDFSIHDIRFVEDDWESPTLGAWGLGWEVWCDGMEVTQFTYFQQMGGFDMKPVAGELTYGLERLAMYIQDKDNVYDLAFNDAGVTLRRRVPRKREADVEVEFRGRRHRQPVRPVPQACRRMREQPRRETPDPRLRTGDQGQPRLQPAAGPRRHLGRRTPGLHRPRPRPGEGQLPGVDGQDTGGRREVARDRPPRTRRPREDARFSPPRRTGAEVALRARLSLAPQWLRQAARRTRRNAAAYALPASAYQRLRVSARTTPPARSR